MTFSIGKEDKENLSDDLIVQIVQLAQDFGEIINSNNNYYNENIIEILNDLERKLINSSFYSNEVMDFGSIKFIFTYMHFNNCFNSEYFSKATSIITQFFLLIIIKINMDSKLYAKFYGDFILTMDDLEQYFYVNIYRPSEYYDEDLLAELFRNLLQ